MRTVFGAPDRGARQDEPLQPEGCIPPPSSLLCSLEVATSTTSTDRIKGRSSCERPARVWRALTDIREFGSWFGVKMESGFAPGRSHVGGSRIPVTSTSSSRRRWSGWSRSDSLSWRWHPAPVDTAVDYSKEPTTLVTFTLDETPDGTRLTVVESGFDQIRSRVAPRPSRMNEGGWTEPLTAEHRAPCLRGVAAGRGPARGAGVGAAPMFAALGDETRLALVARRAQPVRSPPPASPKAR